MLVTLTFQPTLQQREKLGQLMEVDRPAVFVEMYEFIRTVVNDRLEELAPREPKPKSSLKIRRRVRR